MENMHIERLEKYNNKVNINYIIECLSIKIWLSFTKEKAYKVITIFFLNTKGRGYDLKLLHYFRGGRVSNPICIGKNSTPHPLEY